MSIDPVAVVAVSLTMIGMFAAAIIFLMTISTRTGRILERMDAHHGRVKKVEDRVDVIEKVQQEHVIKFREGEAVAKSFHSGNTGQYPLPDKAR